MTETTGAVGRWGLATLAGFLRWKLDAKQPHKIIVFISNVDGVEFRLASPSASPSLDWHIQSRRRLSRTSTRLYVTTSTIYTPIALQGEASNAPLPCASTPSMYKYTYKSSSLQSTLKNRDQYLSLSPISSSILMSVFYPEKGGVMVKIPAGSYSFTSNQLTPHYNSPENPTSNTL